MSSTERPRQRAVREDHLRNHEKLLDAALELFDQHGVDVPLREIGEHAGVSQAGVFRHFTNRDQLIIELYDRASTDLSDRLMATMTDSRDEHAERRLDALFESVVDTVTEHPCYGRLAARGTALYPDRPTDPTFVAELTLLMAAARHAGLLASDVTGFDLVIAPMLVAGTLTHSPDAAAVVPRMMTIMRRGLTPQTHTDTPTPDPAAATTSKSRTTDTEP